MSLVADFMFRGSDLCNLGDRFGVVHECLAVFDEIVLEPANT